MVRKKAPVTALLSEKTLRGYLSTVRSDQVFITHHAQKRMKKRRIDFLQVLNVLRRCSRFEESPWFNHATGDYRFTILGMAAGSDIKVVASFSPAEPIGESITSVITVHLV